MNYPQFCSHCHLRYITLVFFVSGLGSVTLDEVIEEVAANETIFEKKTNRSCMSLYNFLYIHKPKNLTLFVVVRELTVSAKHLGQDAADYSFSSNICLNGMFFY